MKRVVDQLFRDVPGGRGLARSHRAGWTRAELRAAAGRGRRLGRRAGLRPPGGPGAHRGRGRPAGRRPGLRQRARLRAGRRPGGHARLGQPLPRGPGGGRDLRRGGGRGLRAPRGADHRDDPLRLPRASATRCATTTWPPWPRPPAVRHRPARPAAGLRAGRRRRRASATWPPWPAPPTTPGPTGR